MSDIPDWAENLFPPTCWRHGVPEYECRCHPRCSICDLPWAECQCYGEDTLYLTDEEFADIRRGRLVDLWEEDEPEDEIDESSNCATCGFSPKFCTCSAWE